MRLTDSQLARLAEQSGLTCPAIEIVRVRDGATAAYRPRRPLYPASMIKVPLVAAALILSERGEIATGPHPIDPSNLTANDGLSPLIAGYPSTLEELCMLAIVRSDNVATNQLIDLVGRERATALLRAELGLIDTGLRRKLSGGHPLLRDPAQFGRNTHPASDAATLMCAIANGKFPGASFLFLYSNAKNGIPSFRPVSTLATLSRTKRATRTRSRTTAASWSPRPANASSSSSIARASRARKPMRALRR